MASIARPVLSRQLQLRIHPRPANLGESRAILNLMSQFGEIEFYRSLKYDSPAVPNTVLLVYRESSAAAEALRKSPVRFLMGRVEEEEQEGEQEGEGRGLGEEVQGNGVQGGEVGDGVIEAGYDDGRATGPWGLASGIQEQATAWGGAGENTIASPSRAPTKVSQQQQQRQQQYRALSTATKSLPRPPSQRAPFPLIEPSYTAPPTTQHRNSTSPRMFQIFANPSRAKFRDQINFSHFHGNFVVGMDSVQETLVRRLPHGMRGLSVVDWRRGDKPWRVATQERERVGREMRGGLMEMWERETGEVGRG
ncbi:hypothetical protein MBLNU230_g5524t1 [Neophaeotheca triangularis]